jgi:hypothetical protein
MPASRGTSFTTTVRVINRVHGYTTNGWPHTSPTLGTGFTELAQVVFVVTHFANSCPTVDVNFAHLT